MAVPKTLKKIEGMENFRYLTLRHLLRQKNLKLISVWNPTFLTQLLNPLEGWWGSLLNDIQYGTLTLPHQIADNPQKELERELSPRPDRVKMLRSVAPNDYQRIWGKLQLISCWMSGVSKSYAERLQIQFPGVKIQPKGLLATEAFISFPLVAHAGSALAINSHFFEFIPTDAKPKTPLLAHQLEIGKRYEIIVTTSGGFYRYQMHDIIEVLGFYKEVPLIDFVAKSNHISDWFGEKLNVVFVENICEELFANWQKKPRFYLLAPEDAPSGFRYSLYFESEKPANIEILSHQLEQKLSENFHYHYARQLGQLAPAAIKIIPKNSEQKYLAHLQSQGMRLGNIKATRLSNKKGWGDVFS